MLVEGDGTTVTRDDIRKKFWPNDTIVEFDHSINAAIGKLRKVLGDSAEKSQYIETVGRGGISPASAGGMDRRGWRGFPAKRSISSHSVPWRRRRS